MAGSVSSARRPLPRGFEFGDEDELQIDNPLIHKSLAEVKEEARRFAKLVNKESPDEALFIKAGQLAADPQNWGAVDQLNPYEEAALRKEKKTGLLEQPKQLRVSVVLLCLSAVVQGWAESIANCSNLTWPNNLSLHIERDTDDRLIFAGTNAVTWFAAGILGCAIADPLQAWAPFLGRRGIIIMSTCLCIIGAIGSATSTTWQMLMAFRVVFGTGLGAKACTTPIFAAEVSPSHLRGAIVMSWQLFVAAGIASGFLSSLIVYAVDIKYDAWRWQTASIILPLMCLLTITAVCPESPRFLLKQGRYAAAYESLRQLRQTPLQAARDLIYINAQIQVESTLLPNISRHDLSCSDSISGQFVLQAKVRKLSYWTRLTQIFLNKRTRRALQAACIVMTAQQLCGINTLVGYSSDILGSEGGGFGGIAPYCLNLAIGVANFVFTLPAYRFIDSKGRRFLLLIMYPFMILSMLGAALSWLQPSESVRAGLVITFMLLFVMAYSVGQGPVAFTYASEVFPLVYREMAFGFSVFVNMAGLGILTLAVPFVQISAKLPDYGRKQAILLGSFAALNAIAFVLCFFFVPETAGTVINPKQGKINSMSLEELNYIFGVKTLRHARYQITEMGPWILLKLRSALFGPFLARGRDGREVRDPKILWRWVEHEAPDSRVQYGSGDETETASEKAETQAIEVVHGQAEQARERVPWRPSHEEQRCFFCARDREPPASRHGYL